MEPSEPLSLLDNPQALYAEVRVAAKKVINKAIFAKLYINDLEGVAQVADDELNEPYATVIHARRTEAGAMAPGAVPWFTAAASLVCALPGQMRCGGAFQGEAENLESEVGVFVLRWPGPARAGPQFMLGGFRGQEGVWIGSAWDVAG